MAQSIDEANATPSVTEDIPGKILLTEVNFKNSEGDWVEFFYLATGNASINLKGFSFQDDKIFKTIENDFFLEPNKYGVLFFKKNNADKTPSAYTMREGLTGTTDQIIVLDKNKHILDAVCWSNDKPTTSEIADMKKLFEAKGWLFEDPKSCVSSQNVKNSESIIRLNTIDTNTKDDWVISSHPTPGSQNIANAQETPITKETTKTEPAIPTVTEPIPMTITEEVNSPIIELSDQDSEEGKTDETNISLATTAPPETKTSAVKSSSKKQITKKSSTKKKTGQPIYSNGDISTAIIISEFMPNPEKDDTKNEWIELTNKGTEAINLGNWQLDDIEGGSKPYIFSDKTIIEGGKTLLIAVSESKVSLGNAKDSVRLINFEGEVVDEISYEEAPKGQSYARITLQKENGEEEEEWQWLKDSTPNALNPIYQEITATILGNPDFANYSFEAQVGKNETKKFFFDEALIPGPLAQSTFTKGTVIKAVIITKGEDYQLKSYEIINPGTPEPAVNFLPTIIASMSVIIFGYGFWWHKKGKNRKQKEQP